jgi:multicomponent Na+:H+ antiporter subunit A
VALLGPAFADDPVWRPSLLVLGVVTMLLGGLRALVQHDLKLLLAYGTVSQLGFLTAAVGVGTRAAALAGLAMLCAHALFKATLFMVVGIVDHACGTRDLRHLSGLRHRMPGVVTVAALAAASMAGLPPLVGFVAKESVYASFADVATYGEGTGLPSWAGWLTLLGLAVGSALTVAYSLRFVWGLFVDSPDARPPREPDPVPLLFLAPAAVLGVAGLVAAFFGDLWTDLFAGYDHLYPAGHDEEHLALWHGLGLPLWLTLATLVVGTLLHLGRDRWAPVARWGARIPQAEHGYLSAMRALDRV